MFFRVAGLLLLVLFGESLAMSKAEESWELVWEEEFEYTGLPDSTRWVYETGWLRNQEEQWYAGPESGNIVVNDGLLTIEAKQVPKRNNPTYKPGGEKWRETREFIDVTSGSLTTEGKAAWLYGRIELKARLPQGKGVWPCLWTLGDNLRAVSWPKCGEIDILEFIGTMPGTVHGTVHFDSSGKHKGAHGEHQSEADLHGDFHVYAVEWSKDRIEWYFDDVLYHSFNVEDATVDGYNPFRKPQFLLVNLALGGGWAGPLDRSILPQKLELDWVRVWQKQSSRR